MFVTTIRNKEKNYLMEFTSPGFVLVWDSSPSLSSQFLPHAYLAYFEARTVSGFIGSQLKRNPLQVESHLESHLHLT